MKKHIRSISAQRRATAPYNFVPLPERVIEFPLELPDQSTFEDGDFKYNGYIDVTLTARSPLFIRGPLTREQYRTGEKNLPDFFYTVNPSNPVIPGSSLRGMLRAIVEVITYSKVQAVTKKKLFFRTVDNSSIGRSYRDRMTGNDEGQSKVETGFLLRHGDEYTITKCEMRRISRALLRSIGWNNLYDGNGPNQRPKWDYQHHRVWVQADRYKVTALSLTEKTGWQPAVVIITGNMQQKEKEFVFFEPVENAERIYVPEEVVDRFHSDDQLTQWQERAFPKNRPHGPNPVRERDGLLLHNPTQWNEPIFFLREPNAQTKIEELSFFGRAGMFRVPYLRSPYDLVPYSVRDPRIIDFAEAMFGFVRTKDELREVYGDQIPKQGDKRRAYASRISVSDATFVGEQVQFESEISPRVLSSPKPTSFQKYLVQQTEEKNRLAHYDTKTTIRGTKFYWHQGQTPDYLEHDSQKTERFSTQYTRMKPLSAGNTFRFRIHFHHLHEIELGALLWALTLPGEGDHCHKLGMGKALGLGAVKLQPQLYIINRRRRYKTLFITDDSGVRWQKGIRDVTDSIGNAVAAFEQFMTEALEIQKLPFFQIERIAALLKMMNWKPSLTPQEQQEMADEGLSRDRRVLPHPLDVEIG